MKPAEQKKKKTRRARGTRGSSGLPRRVANKCNPGSRRLLSPGTPLGSPATRFTWLGPRTRGFPTCSTRSGCARAGTLTRVPGTAHSLRHASEPGQGHSPRQPAAWRSLGSRRSRGGGGGPASGSSSPCAPPARGAGPGSVVATRQLAAVYPGSATTSASIAVPALF